VISFKLVAFVLNNKCICMYMQQIRLDVVLMVQRKPLSGISKSIPQKVDEVHKRIIIFSIYIRHTFHC